MPDDLLSGSIDLHVHASPDPFVERSLDAMEVAREAKRAGMRGLVLKGNYYPTAPLATIVQKAVGSIVVAGSLALNHAAGGVNPRAVEASARLGAKVLWLPTYDSIRDRSKNGFKDGVAVIDQKGRPLPQLLEILSLVREYGLVIHAGHVRQEEIFVVVSEAKAIGVRKLVITHRTSELAGTRSAGAAPLSLGAQRELADAGVFVEHCFTATTPKYWNGGPSKIVEAVKYIGAERCFLSTAGGQPDNPTPAEAMRLFAASMLQHGLQAAELDILIKRNPARLLDLE